MWDNLLSNFMIILPMLSVAAIATLYSERIGLINIGVNGMMIFGAFLFALTGYGFHQVGFNSNWSQLIAFVIAMVAGGLFALLHAYVSVTLKGDQIISGMALNILASGIALFFVTLPFAKGNQINSGYQVLAADQTQIANLYVLIAFILVIVTFVFFRFTKTGIRYAAIGENPRAIESCGVNVIRMKYYATVWSGMLGGLAGAFYVLINTIFVGNVGGQGFVAIAIMIFGQWRSLLIGIGAIVFAFLISLADYLPTFDNVSAGVRNNAFVLQAVPFLLILVSMMIFSKKNKMPRSLGIPYVKGQR